MTKIYWRGAQGVLVVCDLSNRATLQSTAEWRNRLLENLGLCDVIPMWIVANKSDLKHAFTKSDLEDFARVHKFDGFSITSAKTGENVDWAIKSLA